MVKTMKSLAAVNIRQFERAVESLEAYREVVDNAWKVFFVSGSLIAEVGNPKAEAICVAIGSDQGMCGQFNEALVSYTLEEAERLSKEGEDVTFWSVGEKVAPALEDAGHVVKPFPGADNLNEINALVQAIIQELEARRSSEGTERFYLSHNLLAGGGGYEPTIHRVLPMDKEWMDQYRSQKWPGRCLPVTGLTPETLFTHLLYQYLYVSFFRALAQSLASENAARLMAMQAAEKNILEREEELSASFREQRQANITNELLDIISGFEALSGKSVAI